MRAWSVVSGVVLLIVGVAGQERPVFRASVDLVTVDVHVVDGRGQPIRDLRPEDFAVTVEGAARRVVAADFIAYSPGAVGVDAAAPPTANAADAPSEAGPHVARPPRTVLLVVDEGNIRTGAARAAATAAASFLDRMQPADRVGLLSIPESSTRIEPTTDRAVVRQALNHIVGHFTPVETLVQQQRSLALSEAFTLTYEPQAWRQILHRECVESNFSSGGPGGLANCTAEMEHLARTMMADVRQRMLSSARRMAGLMEAAARTPGPKTIVLISQELPVPSALAERKDFEAEMTLVARAAAQAQASVFVLQLDRPLFDIESRVRVGSGPAAAGADADLASYGLETLATSMGGRRLMVSGRAEPAFDRVAREISGFYVLGFEAAPSDRDGRPHTVTVKVQRAGADVRARRLFAFTEAPQKSLADIVAAVRPAAAPGAPPVPEAGAPPAATPPAPPAVAPSAEPPSAAPVAALAPSVPPAAAPAVAPPSAASTPTTPAENVDDLVARAQRWVVEYAEQLSLVIGIERYAQYMGGEDFSRAYRRELVSEFALVRAKDDWLGFRDVFEVDGKPVHDRQDRLSKLFLDAPATALDQGRKISDESARYNLGAIQRNFNVPTMALFFLHPSNRGRFSFKLTGSEESVDGHAVWKAAYSETRKPTIIRTASGKDMPIKGTFWIDRASGEVVRTHMELSMEVTFGGRDKVEGGSTNNAVPGTGNAPTGKVWDPDGGTVVRRTKSSASISVTYKRDPKLGLLVPDKMLETYEGPTVNRFTNAEEISKVNCSATYSDFHRFETSGRVIFK